MFARAVSTSAVALIGLVVVIAALCSAFTGALGTALSIAASSVQSPASSGAGQAGGSAVGAGTAAPPTGSSRAGVALPAALADIPADYLRLYQDAARTCPGLSWAVLAGIGKIESNHGRSTLPGVASGTVNYAGAGGPMQFLAPTFNGVVAKHAIPPGGANPPSLYNPHDAIYAAADYLCDNGARGGANINAALWTYNHSQSYINQVLAQTNRYYQAAVAAQHAAPPPTPDQSAAGTASPSGASPGGSSTVDRVLAFTRTQIGTPYVWGGNGPASGGFDCSGLSSAAYRAAGITLPRTAQTQYNTGPRLPPGSTAQPGDLVFFGTGPDHVTHVGIATSPTTMIDAPDVGTTVRNDPIQRNLVGITRPTQNP